MQKKSRALYMEKLRSKGNQASAVNDKIKITTYLNGYNGHCYKKKATAKAKKYVRTIGYIIH